MHAANPGAWVAFSILLAAAPAARGAAAGDEYVPLVAGSEYHYEGVFKEKTYTDRIVVKSKKLGDATWFYFSSEDKGQESPLVIGNFPWPGAVRKQGQQILGFDAALVKWLERFQAGKEQVFLKLPLKKGDRTEIAVIGGQRKQTVTVLDFEDVTVPAGTFKNCAKIQAIARESEDPPETFWLAPGVGLVKWQKFSGRVDVLTKYSIPK
jgi:hypothetical protein